MWGGGVKRHWSWSCEALHCNLDLSTQNNNQFSILQICATQQKGWKSSVDWEHTAKYSVVWLNHSWTFRQCYKALYLAKSTPSQLWNATAASCKEAKLSSKGQSLENSRRVETFLSRLMCRFEQNTGKGMKPKPQRSSFTTRNTVQD